MSSNDGAEATLLDDEEFLVPCHQGHVGGSRPELVHAVPVGPQGEPATTLCRRPARRVARVFDPAAPDACKRCAAKALGLTR